MSDTGGRKYRDPKSQNVVPPASPPRPIVQGMFVYIDGWFGLVNFSPYPDPRGEITLNIENASWFTSQFAPGSTDTWTRGEELRFDTSTWYFVKAGGIVVGKVKADGPDGAGFLEWQGALEGQQS